MSVNLREPRLLNRRKWSKLLNWLTQHSYSPWHFVLPFSPPPFSLSALSSNSVFVSLSPCPSVIANTLLPLHALQPTSHCMHTVFFVGARRLLVIYTK